MPGANVWVPELNGYAAPESLVPRGMPYHYDVEKKNEFGMP